MLIVTLSTIPSRFESISRTIDSLLAQDIKVDAIELYLPKQYRRFPDWKQTVPALDSSVDVVMIDTDLGPATKVLPACERYAGKSVDILYCDDDQIYPPGWARSFIDARRYHPNEAIAVCG
jgi:hypothetical protein